MCIYGTRSHVVVSMLNPRPAACSERQIDWLINQVEFFETLRNHEWEIQIILGP